jgi:hypothetical protein
MWHAAGCGCDRTIRPHERKVVLTNDWLLTHHYAAPAAAIAVLLFRRLQFNVTGETLDQALLLQQQQQQAERIALLKLDIEGYEPQALASATQLLQKQLIDNVLLEYSPHIVERNK